jgi:hypothetical protein
LETLIKLLDKAIAVLVGTVAALLFVSVGLPILLAIITKGFVVSLKERDK